MSVTACGETRFKILQVGSSYLIWNSEDATGLRNVRIIGALVGTMATSQQNERATLPLKLMMEQVIFLQAKGMANVFRYKHDAILHRDDDVMKTYENWIQLEIDKQIQESHQKRIESSLGRACEIAKGRKARQVHLSEHSNTDCTGEPRSKQTKHSRKQSVTVTPDEVASVEQELLASPIRRLRENELYKEIWTESPLLSGDDHLEPVSAPLQPRNDRERLRYAVFVDLWEKGYYLSPGVKFGGNFLAYAGDPLLYHSSYVVVCLPESPSLDRTDYAAWCRLGSQVKKVILLCTWSEHDKAKIAYKAVQWRSVRMLSLVNWCLLAIRDHIEAGRLRHVHELPPRWHQIILDFILMHGTILKDNCLSALSTTDFLRAFASLSTFYGRVNDDKYLDRVSKAFAKINTQGNDTLVRLALNLYTAAETGPAGKQQTTIQNMGHAIRLVSKCPKLRSLQLYFNMNKGEINEPNGGVIRFLPLSSTTSPSTWKPLGDGGFLNAIDAYRPCLAILENLTDFSLITVDSTGRRLPPLLTSHTPLIAFKKLSSLRLIGGTAYFDVWFKFLNSLSATLQFLHVENVEFHWGRERNACVLPFRMPQLISLKAHGALSYCDSTFIKNLQKCERLQFISLTLSGLESEDNLLALSAIDAVKDVRLNFRHGVFAERGVDKVIGTLVALFGDKITSFVFNGVRTSPFSDACGLLIDGCKNLVTLRLDTTSSLNEADQSYLAPLFKDKRRAFKLRDVEFHGRLSSLALSSLFDNCLNLESLAIHNCPQLTDAHLRKWADHGAQPNSFKLINCPKVTDVGLVCILSNCGLGLTHFRCSSTEMSLRITERTTNALAEYCRNVEWFCVPATACSDNVLTKIRSKSFKFPVTAVLV